MNDQIIVLKEPLTASKFLNSKSYKELWGSVNDNFNEGSLSIIGHTRLATNGVQDSNSNNHPIVKNGAIGVHNGIVVNVDSIKVEFPGIELKSEVDTELLLALLQKYRDKENSLNESVRETYEKICGETSLAVIFDDLEVVLLATNTGSLYIYGDEHRIFFASERYILEQILTNGEKNKIEKICANSTSIIDIKNIEYEINAFDVTHKTVIAKRDNKSMVKDLSPNYDLKRISRTNNFDKISKMIQDNYVSDENLIRCTNCLLPHTFPFIKFDSEGVCNYCREYVPFKVRGKDTLEELIAPYRKQNGNPDCVVGFSGGRDSSYMLHYLKQELGLNPVAFTYDWGMVTDLARRNQARICGKLGIEHIWVSADITRKRENVRKNIEAWLKKPDLGMVPLLMAGDKQFFYHAHKVKEQVKSNLLFFGPNIYERTLFKTGFCGIKESNKGTEGILVGLNILNKIKLIVYYLLNYLKNPSYINSSLYDTLHAYYSAYFLPNKGIHRLYYYIHWDEEEIERVLNEEYDWEMASDTKTSWRIGDGTAAFYNYIYYTLAGFTEFDTFRSNQIREGLLSRDQALRLVREENKPRIESLIWYANTIGFDLENALKKIHTIKRLL